MEYKILQREKTQGEKSKSLGPQTTRGWKRNASLLQDTDNRCLLLHLPGLFSQ